MSRDVRKFYKHCYYYFNNFAGIGLAMRQELSFLMQFSSSKIIRGATGGAMDDGTLENPPEYEIFIKPLLETGLADEVIHIEVPFKDIDYYLSLIPSEKDREIYTPLLEKVLSDEAVEDVLIKILMLFPEKTFIVPVLENLIMDCIFYSTYIHKSTKNGKGRMPNPKETKEHLGAIIKTGKVFLEKIKALHPENWTMIAYMNPTTGEGEMSKDDFREWDEFLETTRSFLEKAESIKERVSKRTMRGRTDEDDRAAAENVYLKARDIYRGITKKEPSVSTDNYITGTNQETYSGKFIELIEILYPGVLNRTEISTFYKNRTGLSPESKCNK